MYGLTVLPWIVTTRACRLRVPPQLLRLIELDDGSTVSIQASAVTPERLMHEA
jgi:hypothetical protein